MKRIHFFPILLLAGLIACTSEVSYSISGTSASDGKTVYLVDQATGETLDSALVEGGSFTLAGKAAKEALLYISEEGSDWMTMFFNDGTPVVVSLADTTLQGSPLNEKLLETDKALSASYQALIRLSQVRRTAPAEERAALDKQLELAYEAYQGQLKNIVEENRDNLLPAAFASQILEELDDEEAEEFFSEEHAYARHPSVQIIKEKWEETQARWKAIREENEKVIGQPFLDLEEPDADGNLHSLSEYLGKGNWVLVDFWASWCSPCRAEMPNVVAAYEQYHPKGFQVVSLSFDNDKEAWTKAIVDLKMPWIHLSDLKGWQTVASEVYTVKAIPDNILVDPEGKIVARGLRGEDLGAKLAEIYQ